LIAQQGQSKIELFAESSVRFFAKVVDVELAFIWGRDGKVAQMELYQDGQTLTAKKIE